MHFFLSQLHRLLNAGSDEEPDSDTCIYADACERSSKAELASKTPTAYTRYLLGASACSGNPIWLRSNKHNTSPPEVCSLKSGNRVSTFFYCSYSYSPYVQLYFFCQIIILLKHSLHKLCSAFC